MALHGIGAVETAACAGATGNRLVVLHAIVAERQVVHRALGIGHDAERAVQRVGHALRRFDIAGDHGGRPLRVEEAARRHDKLDGREAAVIQRDVTLDEGAQHVQRGRARDRQRGIEVAVVLRRAAAEIDDGRAAFARHADGHADRQAVVHLQFVAPVFQYGQFPFHAVGGVVAHALHVLGDGIDAERIEHAFDLARALA